MSRVLALIGTVALALGGVVVSGAAAQADGSPTIPPPGNIEGSSGILSIHKHAGNPGQAGNGQAIADESGLGAGVDGITFTIERVWSGTSATPISLTTTDGWNLAKTASDGFVPSTGALPTGFGVVSPAAGSWTTTGGGLASGTLPFGLYRVTEVPNAAVVDEVTPSFLVTLPYPSSGTWLNNVHVYPKNKLKDSPTKTVAAPVSTSGLPAVVEGSQVTWTITAPVTRPASGSTYTSFTISDPLNAQLKYVSAVVKIDGVVQVVGTDYTLGHTGAAPVTGQGGTVLISLTGALDDLEAGQVVTVELVTTVHGEGEITNTAVRNVNGTDTTIGTPQTNWGKVKVRKHNANQALLDGAKFELYKADQTTLVYAEQSTVGGEILFDAVWLGDNSDKSEQYCLKETQAPPGYITPTGTAAWTCVTVTTTPTAIKEVSVNNTQQPGPGLPLTGSTGTAVFMVSGLALIAAAAGVGLLSRRRNQTANRR